MAEKLAEQGWLVRVETMDAALAARRDGLRRREK
jgi:hypothetical protein